MEAKAVAARAEAGMAEETAEETAEEMVEEETAAVPAEVKDGGRHLRGCTRCRPYSVVAPGRQRCTPASLHP